MTDTKDNYGNTSDGFAYSAVRAAQRARQWQGTLDDKRPHEADNQRPEGEEE